MNGTHKLGASKHQVLGNFQPFFATTYWGLWGSRMTMKLASELLSLFLKCMGRLNKAPILFKRKWMVISHISSKKLWYLHELHTFLRSSHFGKWGKKFKDWTCETVFDNVISLLKKKKLTIEYSILRFISLAPKSLTMKLLSFSLCKIRFILQSQRQQNQIG